MSQPLLDLGDVGVMHQGVRRRRHPQRVHTETIICSSWRARGCCPSCPWMPHSTTRGPLLSHAEADGARLEAQQFLEAIRALLPADIGNVMPESATNPDMGEHER
jgi:hypothetical protein